MILLHYVMSLFVLDNLCCSEVCFIEISMTMTAFFWLELTGVSISVLHKNRTSSRNIYSVYTSRQLPVLFTHKKLIKVSGARAILDSSFFQNQLRDTLMTQRDRDKNISIGPERKWLTGTLPSPSACPTHVGPLPHEKQLAHQNPCSLWKEDPTEPATIAWGEQALLVSCGYYQNVPQIWWLTTQFILWQCGSSRV